MQIKFVTTSETLSDGLPYTEITFTERNSRIEVTEILGKILPEVTLRRRFHLTHDACLLSWHMQWVLYPAVTTKWQGDSDKMANGFDVHI